MNAFYRIAVQQARKIISNPSKSKRTLDRALNKSNRIKSDEPLLKRLKNNVFLFFNLLKDFITGKYRKLPLSSAIKVLGALIYFLFVADLIPDFLAVVGLTDDAAVLAWVISAIGVDLDKYRSWKNERKEKQQLLEKQISEDSQFI